MLVLYINIIVYSFMCILYILVLVHNEGTTYTNTMNLTDFAIAQDSSFPKYVCYIDFGLGLLRGYGPPTPLLTCFVLYLKIIQKKK